MARPHSIPLNGCPPLDPNKEYMMGIDEAGRGPTLGPMVYGSAFCAVDDEPALKAMGFMDSKVLTEAKRDQLWAELQRVGYIGWAIRVLEAAEIAEGMLAKTTKYNLNAMSRTPHGLEPPTPGMSHHPQPRGRPIAAPPPPADDAAIGLVQGVLDLGVNLRYLYVDTVGDPDHYRRKLEGIFPTLQIVVEKKADGTYPIVSAGSICAKVPRDTILSEWTFEDPDVCSDREWGCGYPSDKHTKRWMEDNLHPIFGWPDLVRFSWGPALTVLQKEPEKHGACVVKWPDEEEIEGSDERHGMASFLGQQQATKRRKVDRVRLLHEAGLEPVESW